MGLGKNSGGKKLAKGYMREIIDKYPSRKEVPTSIRRKFIEEYISEGRKGADGYFPKQLHRKKSANDGFASDLFNEKLLESYT